MSRTISENYLRRIIREEKARTVRRSPRLSSLLFEDKDDASADSPDRGKIFPTELDKVDPAIAKVIVKSGDMDKDKSDDIIEVSPKTWSCSELKPSQTTMRIDNTVGMAFSMLAGKMDMNLGCIVSSDNHIMDGHHRWSAAILVDPASKVSGYGAPLPGKELLGVLNVLTKGLFGKNKGNPGKGSIDNYTPENVKTAIEAFLKKGSDYIKPDQAEKLLTDKYGSVEKGIETMSKNVESMSKEVPGWAPDRIQMPVIDPKEVPAAAKALASGKVDTKEPYATVVKRAISGKAKSDDAKKESVLSTEDNVIMERWSRLAGLLDD